MLAHIAAMQGRYADCEAYCQTVMSQMPETDKTLPTYTAITPTAIVSVFDTTYVARHYDYIHVLSPLHEFGFNDFTSLFYDYGNEKKK